MKRFDVRRASSRSGGPLGETLVVLQGDGPVYVEAGRVQLITVA